MKNLKFPDVTKLRKKFGFKPSKSNSSNEIIKTLRKVDREITKSLSKPLVEIGEYEKKEKETKYMKLSLDYNASKQFLLDTAEDLNNFFNKKNNQDLP